LFSRRPSGTGGGAPGAARHSRSAREPLWGMRGHAMPLLPRVTRRALSLLIRRRPMMPTPRDVQMCACGALAPRPPASAAAPSFTHAFDDLGMMCRFQSRFLHSALSLSLCLITMIYIKCLFVCVRASPCSFVCACCGCSYDYPYPCLRPCLFVLVFVYLSSLSYIYCLD